MYFFWLPESWLIKSYLKKLFFLSSFLVLSISYKWNNCSPEYSNNQRANIFKKLCEKKGNAENWLDYELTLFLQHKPLYCQWSWRNKISCPPLNLGHQASSGVIRHFSEFTRHKDFETARLSWIYNVGSGSHGDNFYMGLKHCFRFLKSVSDYDLFPCSSHVFPQYLLSNESAKIILILSLRNKIVSCLL